MSAIWGRLGVRHVVVPYGRANATVKARALRWIERAVAAELVAEADVVVHGPDWPRRTIPSGGAVLLLRNVGRLTRGRRETRLLSRAAQAVYDLDDGLPWDFGNLPGLGRWWKRPLPRALVAARAAGAADRVIAGNELLADWASSHCRDVRIVPTCVEPDEYSHRSSWDVGEVPLIGWIGSNATEHYLSDIAPPLAEVHRATGARLEVVSGPGRLDPRLAPFATRLGWTPSANDRIASWDVGIMPLRDGPYERAKCGYKLLQYAASGVPAVGSPVGVSERLLDEMDGLAPQSPREWVDALAAVLTESAERRQRRAIRGTAVANAYSYDAWQTAWLDAVGW